MAHSSVAAQRLRLTLPLVLGGACLAGFVGCSQAPEIRAYSAPKQQTANSVEQLQSAAAADSQPALTYDTPEGWIPGPAGGMRKAAFRVEDGNRQVEITVIDLAAAAGDLLPNVNRWRQQIQLPPVTQQELDATLQKIQVDDVEGVYEELVGPADADAREAILGVVAVRGGKAWFFKLKGEAELALREKDRFQAFVKSVRFDTTDGASDGQ